FGADVVEFTANVAEPRPPVTAADFVFVDDTNVGTPSVGVSVNTQGSTSSVTLNGFISDSTLTLQGPGFGGGSGLLGNHIVNLNAQTANDVLNLNLFNNGNHGTVQANGVETVNINTDFSVPAHADVLNLNNTGLQVLNVVGNDALTLTTNSTGIQTVDASGL